MSTVLKIAILSIVLCAVVGIYIATLLYFHINFSKSMPRGVYLNLSKPVARGDLVEVCLPSALSRWGQQRGYIGYGHCTDGSEPLLKAVVGVAGDSVTLTFKSIAINDETFPHTATQLVDSQGRKMALIPRGHYRLNPGYVWLMGTHSALSWDSRYFGAVNVAQIQTVVKPIWVFSG